MHPRSVLHASVAAAALLMAAPVTAFPQQPECIVPARPGGGFEFTCLLLQSGLLDEGLLKEPMRITYMPGGVGAMAYNTVIAQRSADDGLIVAFSSGSLLNLAEGKFGKHTENDVRWLAALGTDYGTISVRDDSPIRNLKDLAAAMRADPAKVVFGAAGTVGGQDWMKAALIAKSVGLSHRDLRFVAFEGGGEALVALRAGYVQVVSGDASEAAQSTQAGQGLRVIAVLAPERLPGRLSDVPTAKEQEFDIVWPTIRGFYMGPRVSEAGYRQWQAAFDTLLASERYAKLRGERGLHPLTPGDGQAFAEYVKREVRRYRALAREFGLGRN